MSDEKRNGTAVPKGKTEPKTIIRFVVYSLIGIFMFFIDFFYYAVRILTGIFKMQIPVFVQGIEFCNIRKRELRIVTERFSFRKLALR